MMQQDKPIGKLLDEISEICKDGQKGGNRVIDACAGDEDPQPIIDEIQGCFEDINTTINEIRDKIKEIEAKL